MSFAKSKRFIEKIPIGPSPTEYTINTAQKQIGAVIPKSQRFVEPKSPVPSEHGGGSVKSFSSTPLFRTPTLPKRKKYHIQSPAAAAKTKLFQLESDTEALKEKIVECQNKDMYIHDQNEQIEELKQKLSSLEKEKLALEADLSGWQERSEDAEIQHQSALDQLYGQHHKEMENLRGEISNVRDELTTINEEYMQVKEEKQAELKKLVDNMDSFQKLYKDMCEAYNKEINTKEESLETKEQQLLQLEQEMFNLQRNHADEIDRLTKQHNREVQDIEYEMLKTLTEMQNALEQEKNMYEKHLQDMSKEHQAILVERDRQREEEKQRILLETDAKIKQVEENTKEEIVLAEIQMQEKMRDMEITWGMKVQKQQQESDAILKECQEISEYNIIQCEIEKNKIANDLAEMQNELQKLAREKCDVEVKLKVTKIRLEELVIEIKLMKNEQSIEKVELEAQIDELTNKLLEAAKENKKYDITIRYTQDSIEALKKRLLNSDRDVEQLKTELEICEEEKIEFEAKCNELSEQLEDALNVNDNYKQDVQIKIKSIEETLLKKLEDYKGTATNSIESYIKKIDIQNELLCKLQDQLDKQSAINAMALKLNENYEHENTEYESENKQLNKKLIQLDHENQDLQQQNNKLQEKYETMELLKKRLAQAQDKNDSYYKYLEYYKIKTAEYEDEIEEVADVRRKYIDQSGKYDDLLHKYEILMQKSQEQNALIEPFRQQLEKYKYENMELTNQVGDSENEARNIALKYAELLGHQNNKQKIKHFTDLKTKMLHTQMDLKEERAKGRAQAKLIEKLREELDSVKKSTKKSKISQSDKENVASPNRTLNSSRVESPGPLRERN